MKLAILYSGGKDSTLALMKAKELHEIACLISIVSENKESFMFHTPNIRITSLQSKAMNIPLVSVSTKGEKEKELEDLKFAIIEAVNKYGVEGIVTGAVRSTYQASRVQRICQELGLWCFAPLWLKDQLELLDDVINSGIKAVISGVFAEPLDERYLGKEMNKEMTVRLASVASSHHISPAGEGGEIETTVLDAPFFAKRIIVKKSSIEYLHFSGVYNIEAMELVDK